MTVYQKVTKKGTESDSITLLRGNNAQSYSLIKRGNNAQSYSLINRWDTRVGNPSDQQAEYPGGNSQQGNPLINTGGNPQQGNPLINTGGTLVVPSDQHWWYSGGILVVPSAQHWWGTLVVTL